MAILLVNINSKYLVLIEKEIIFLNNTVWDILGRGIGTEIILLFPLFCFLTLNNLFYNPLNEL
jgi:hypothetical protein